MLSGLFSSTNRWSRLNTTTSLGLLLTSGLAPALWAQTAPVVAPAGGAAPALSPTASNASSAPSMAASDTNESPRERGRVLQKRNPIASEYQSFGDVGMGAMADGDAEGVDYRAGFPAQRITGRRDSLKLGAEWNYNHLSGSSEWGGSVLGQVGWADGSWALAVQVRSSGADRAVEHFQAAWSELVGGLDQNTATTGDEAYYLDRPRFTQDKIYTRDNRYTAQLEWAPTEHQLFYLRAFHQDYFDRNYRNRLELQFGAGAFQVEAAEGDTITQGVVTGGKTRRYFGDTITHRDRDRLVLGGETKQAWGGVSYSVYYHRWDLNPYWWDWNFNDTNVSLRYRTDDPSYPTYEVLNGQDFLNTDTARFTSLRLHPTQTRDEDYAGRADLEYRIDALADPTWLYAGVLHREKQRTNEEPTEVYTAKSGNLFTLTDVGLTAAPGLIAHDRYEQPSGLAPTSAAQFFYANPDKFDYKANSSLLESYQQHYTAEEAVTGAYLLGARTMGRWTTQLGLRAERTATDTLGTLLIPANLDDPAVGVEVDRVIENPADPTKNTVVKQLQASRSYTNYLPSAQLEFAPNAQWTLRAAWSQVLMRPQYFDIVNYRRINYPTRSISEGNPDLQPTRITQYQLAAQWATPTWGTFSAELYQLRIKDFFYGAAGTEYIDGEEYTVSRVENGEDGTIRGFTLQAEKAWKLPSGWTFTPTFGYTYSDHEAELATRPGATIPVPARSKHLVTSSLALRDTQWRFDVGYNYQSSALDDIGATPAQDGYRGEVVALSSGVSYRYNAHWQMGMQLFNILDSAETATVGNDLRVTNTQYAGWYGVVNAEYTF